MRRGHAIMVGGASVAVLGIMAVGYWAFSANNADAVEEALSSQVARQEIGIQTLDGKISAYWTVIEEAMAANHVPIPDSPEAYSQNPLLATTGFEGAVNRGLRDAIDARAKSVEQLAALGSALQEKRPKSGKILVSGILAGYVGSIVGLFGYSQERRSAIRKKSLFGD